MASPTDNMTTGDVADLLKGPKGTTVHITVLREGAEKPIEFAVVRDEIPRYSVDLHFMIRPGIGYMHVSGFNETTEHEVAAALDEMGELKGLILDLRQNPGGLLSEESVLPTSSCARARSLFRTTDAVLLRSATWLRMATM